MSIARALIFSIAACFPIEVIATSAKAVLIIYSLLLLPFFIYKKHNRNYSLVLIFSLYLFFILINTRDFDFYSLKVLFNLFALFSLVFIGLISKSSKVEIRFLLLFAILFLVLRAIQQNLFVDDRLPIYQTQIWNFSYIAIYSLNYGVLSSILLTAVAGIRSFGIVLVFSLLIKRYLNSIKLVIFFSSIFGASTLLLLIYLRDFIEIPGSMSWRFWHWTSLLSLIDGKSEYLLFGLGNGSSWRYLDDLNLPYILSGEIKDAHSHYVKILVDQGLVGLAFYLVLILSIVGIVTRDADYFEKRKIYLILFVYLSAGFYDDGVHELNLFWVILLVYVKFIRQKKQIRKVA